METPFFRKSAFETIKCYRFEGKVAVITGSTDGIGFAIAERLAAEGASVVVSSRKKENVERAVKDLEGKGYNNVCGVVCHISDAQQREILFKRAIDRFGHIDILVANAAANPGVGSILKIEESAWDKIFEVNLKNNWQLSQLAIREFERINGGVILYIGSVSGYELRYPVGAYAVSKTALLGLTKTIAKEYATHNIRVNCLVAGLTKTRFAEILLKKESYQPGNMTDIPMQRVADPTEIAAAAAFLLSDDASYVTGENFVVGGGYACHL